MTTPTPAPAPMPARLRELEAGAAELANKLADAAVHWRTKEFDDLCHVNTGVIIEALRNTPTLLRLLEAVEGMEKELSNLFDTDGRPTGKPRIIDLCYTAFDIAKRKNDEDGGPTDWFHDTKPRLDELIASVAATLRAAREVKP